MTVEQNVGTLLHWWYVELPVALNAWVETWSAATWVAVLWVVALGITFFLAWMKRRHPMMDGEDIADLVTIGIPVFGIGGGALLFFIGPAWIPLLSCVGAYRLLSRIPQQTTVHDR